MANRSRPKKITRSVRRRDRCREIATIEGMRAAARNGGRTANWRIG
jgi:hypothetical protein